VFRILKFVYDEIDSVAEIVKLSTIVNTGAKMKITRFAFAGIATSLTISFKPSATA